MRSAGPLPVRELDLECQCSDLLALDGWRSLKTDPVSRREWGKGFGEKGMADRLYIRYGYVVLAIGPSNAKLRAEDCDVMWIEWKRPRGKLKPHQADWIELERARGALVLVAGLDFPAVFEGFCEWYSKSGLMRRTGLC